MTNLKASNLYSLEEYARVRPEFRTRVIEHKKNRRVSIGEYAALYFEDELTMQYQVQEMLRIERIFEQDGIEEELDVYNPLIPDGSNWKATFMIEYSDIEQRKEALAKLIGVEKVLYIQVADFDRVYPVTNEDLERETKEKTSAVHFVRFELSDEMVSSAKQGAAITAGIDHPEYRESSLIPNNVHASLVSDLH
ncbi:MAG: DUF3501 family protein [gamma proteobacterium symbiont of Taylorina sp.]|nr:DUF3501 family protein [gamma proteobacterium symbiont of Taylorina sp.]